MPEYDDPLPALIAELDQAVDDEIKPWDSDHTALVHVLWKAVSAGITITDADDLAEHIMCSKWMQAVRQHAIERSPVPCVPTEENR